MQKLICRIRLNDDSKLKDKIINIRNPLKALNGLDSESSNKIRQYTSLSGDIKKYNKAVTEDDYIKILQSHPEIKSASASIEWIGTWYIVSIVIERYNRKNIDNEFKEKILAFINDYRLSGYDIKITGSSYIPLYIILKISIDNNYFRNETRQRLLQAFGNTSTNNLNSQTKGLFHSDNLHLGQHIFYSRIHETAMSVAGVKSVSFVRFQRLGLNVIKTADEKIPAIILANNEIPIIDNDPAYPNNGIIEFIIDGGL